MTPCRVRKTLCCAILAASFQQRPDYCTSRLAGAALLCSTTRLSFPCLVFAVASPSRQSLSRAHRAHYLSAGRFATPQSLLRPYYRSAGSVQHLNIILMLLSVLGISLPLFAAPIESLLLAALCSESLHAPPPRNITKLFSDIA